MPTYPATQLSSLTRLIPEPYDCRGVNRPESENIYYKIEEEYYPTLNNILMV